MMMLAIFESMRCDELMMLAMQNNPFPATADVCLSESTFEVKIAVKTFQMYVSDVNVYFRRVFLFQFLFQRVITNPMREDN